MSSLNANPNELNHFACHAQDWWNPNGSFKTLHEINPIRLGFVLDAGGLEGKKIVDIGTGGGILAESLAKLGGKVTGIDAEPTVISVAREHAQANQLAINYIVTTAETFAQTHAGEFDIVTCMELLEHVPDPISLIQACSKLLKPQGNAFFSTINRTPKAYALTILGAEYILKWIPKGTHRYDAFIRPAELATWLRSAQLDLKTLRGMRYQLFSRQFQLCEDTSVNYLLHAQKAL